MKSKVIGACLVLVVAVGLLSSCSSTVPIFHSGVTTKIVEKDYEVLGRVESVGTIQYIMGFNMGGGASYSYLMHKAMQEYGADDVINITKDLIHISGLVPFYYEHGYILTGLAIKYK